MGRGEPLGTTGYRLEAGPDQRGKPPLAVLPQWSAFPRYLDMRKTRVRSLIEAHFFRAEDCEWHDKPDWPHHHLNELILRSRGCNNVPHQIVPDRFSAVAGYEDAHAAGRNIHRVETEEFAAAHVHQETKPNGAEQTA